jgi:hypothetical protein
VYEPLCSGGEDNLPLLVLTLLLKLFYSIMKCNTKRRGGNFANLFKANINFCLNLKALNVFAKARWLTHSLCV